MKDAIVAGHDIKSALCFNTGSVAHCVYDSLNSLIITERGRVKSKLASLAKGLLVQPNKMHDPVEDAFTSLEIFLKLSECCVPPKATGWTDSSFSSIFV